MSRLGRVIPTGWRRILFFLFAALSLGVMIAIFCFSAETAEDSAASSSNFLAFLAELFYKDTDAFYANLPMEQTTVLNLLRKLAHGGIYATLGFLSFGTALCALAPRRLSGKLILTGGFTLLYAISDEIHQLFVPGRGCQLRDVLIDFTGACAGILMMLLLYRFICFLLRRKSKKE